MVNGLLNLEPALNDEELEILAGLNKAPKQISPKFFYDEAGSRLFEEICRQPEYYPTRTELQIMQENIREIAELVGQGASLIEFGSGSSIKTRLLLRHLPELAAYVPVDISKEHLVNAAEDLADEFPDIEVLPVCADFTRPFELPRPTTMPKRNLVFFPGSTIGNFSRDEALDLIRVMREEAKDNGALLIGVDLTKPKQVLEAAYNDAAGVTSDFNLNLLRRLNREHNANFRLSAFRHLAVYDTKRNRIEMRLISLKKQAVKFGDQAFTLDKGEYIVTEHSHKYTIAEFTSMAEESGFARRAVWTDAKELFSVQYLEAA